MMTVQVTDGQHARMGRPTARQLAQSAAGTAAQNTRPDACAWNDARFTRLCRIRSGCYRAGVSVGQSDTHA